jgi:hypothetical protein
MTIQKAIQSGKPFRRRCQRKTNGWMIVVKSWGNRKTFGVLENDKPKVGWTIDIFNPQDILADDWELKRESRQ